MRLLAFSGLLLVALQAPGIDAAKAAGHWVGAGRFLDLTLQERYGSLPFDLVIHPDHALEGRVGGATLPRCVPRKQEGRWEYQAPLRGMVRSEEAFRKDQLVLIVTRVEGDQLGADFQLKTAGGLDLAAWSGRLEARRAP